MKTGLSLIVRRSLREHMVSTLITVISIALGTGLVMAVLAIKSQTVAAFTGGPFGFDAVLGARGSQLQLVLNTIFHLETSPGNLPWKHYVDIKDDDRVDLAIPYALGDNYRGYRIVGSTEELFTDFEFTKGKKFEVYPRGRFFDPARREAVVGSVVARRLGLGIGSHFEPYHGLSHEETHKHDEEYIVVGVLQPTNSPNDRVIWIPIEGIFRMGGHVLRGSGTEFQAKPGEAIPDEHKEVSAVMLRLKGPQVGYLLDGTINKQGKDATLAWPIGRIMARFFNKVGWMSDIMELIAYLVVVVAAASILASLYNAMNERRREFAVFRALGARRRTVSTIIVLEAGTIAGLGALLGFVVHGAIFIGASAIVRARTGIVLDLWTFHWIVVLAPIGVTVLGAVAGVLPAMKAYRTDVASHL